MTPRRVQVLIGLGTGVATLLVVLIVVLVMGDGGDSALPTLPAATSPSSRLATFYAMYGCDLAAAARDATEIAQFPLRGSGMELAGITCLADGIEVTGARNTGGSEWEVSTIFYQWAPALGEFQGSLGATAILTSPADDDAIQSHADWNC